jgi:hypothetical protein
VTEPKGDAEVVLGQVPIEGLYDLDRWQPGQYLRDGRRFKLPGWKSDVASLCFELVDNYGETVAATGADGTKSKCVFVGTEQVEVTSKKPK